MRLRNRVESLEGHSRYLTMWEMLDSLDGRPLDPNKKLDPAFVAALEVMD